MQNYVMSRRTLLRRASMAAAGLGLAGSGMALAARDSGSASDLVPYGAAVRSGMLDIDADYRTALAARCQMIVPEGELKWADLRPTRDQYDTRPRWASVRVSASGVVDSRWAE